MNLNKIVYPYPKSSQKKVNILREDIIFIEGKKVKLSKQQSQKKVNIPCLYNQFYHEKSDKILFYLHGNAEDIITTKEITDYLKLYLECDTLSIEYPGYSIYQGTADDNQILQDIISVYKHFTENLNFLPENIFVLGRSIGSGPATFLAAKHKIGGLILMAPFTSLQNVIGDYLGRCFQKIIKERFENHKYIGFVTCPTMFIHGKKDKVIHYKHSQQLFEICQAKVKTIKLFENMSHGEFDFERDMALPIFEFLSKLPDFKE